MLKINYIIHDKSRYFRQYQQVSEGPQKLRMCGKVSKINFARWKGVPKKS